MNKQNITDYLNKFDYDFEEREGEIIIRLDFNLEIIVDLNNPNKIKISDKLGSMNFLSWPFSKSIKGTMLYNFIGSVIVFICFLSIQDSTNSFFNSYVLTLVVIFAAFWNLFWLIYYLTISENLKQEIKALMR